MGTIYALTNGAATAEVRYNYSVFGRRTRVLGDLSQPWGFAGRSYDANGALLYARHRFLSSEVGAWTRPDPEALRLLLWVDASHTSPAASVVGTSLYGYVGNRPTSLLDPSGNWVVYIGLTGALQLIVPGVQLEIVLLVDGEGGLGLAVTPAVRLGLDITVAGGITAGWFPHLETIADFAGASAALGLDFVWATVAGMVSPARNACGSVPAEAHYGISASVSAPLSIGLFVSGGYTLVFQFLPHWRVWGGGR